MGEVKKKFLVLNFEKMFHVRLAICVQSEKS
jgi:hypothetical protein